MRRETQNILLILLGGALVKIAVNGDYLRYVKPAQQPWIITGGAVMVLLGAVAIVRDVLSARTAARTTPAPGASAASRPGSAPPAADPLASRPDASALALPVADPHEPLASRPDAPALADPADLQPDAWPGNAPRPALADSLESPADARPGTAARAEFAPGLPDPDAWPGKALRPDLSPDSPDPVARRSVPSDSAPGHDHAHSTRPAWLLLLPVLAVFLIAPPALGADSVIRTEARAPSTAAAANAAAFPPLPARAVVPLPLNEFVSRAGWDSAGTLNGRTVELTGFVVHAEGNTLLARLVISCCAADAFPVTVRLTGTEAQAFASDAWIRVTGKVVPGTATKNNSYTPDFTTESVTAVPTPKDPYEY